MSLHIYRYWSAINQIVPFSAWCSFDWREKIRIECIRAYMDHIVHLINYTLFRHARAGHIKLRESWQLWDTFLMYVVIWISSPLSRQYKSIDSHVKSTLFFGFSWWHMDCRDVRNLSGKNVNINFDRNSMDKKKTDKVH